MLLAGFPLIGIGQCIFLFVNDLLVSGPSLLHDLFFFKKYCFIMDFFLIIGFRPVSVYLD